MPDTLASPSLDDLVSSLVTATDTPSFTFAALLDAVHRTGYTGPLVLHCQHGRPKALEFPRPSITLKLA